MRKFGWERMMVVLGLTWAASAVQVDASYVLSIVGNGTTYADANGAAPGWGVQPGGTFQVDAVMTGSGPIDSAIFNVNVTGSGSPNYISYQWENTAFQTGSNNDFSVPKGALDTGVVAGSPAITNALYAFTPAISDVHFEAITRDGQTFSNGTIVTLTLKVPDTVTAASGPYTISPVADEFALFGEVVPTTNGSSLSVVVVPEPATLVLLGLGGLAAVRRRFIGA